MKGIPYQLEVHSKPGELWTPLGKKELQCHACGFECILRDGAAGTCRVRVNRGGELLAPWGFVAIAQTEPVEKKPFFHIMPGSSTFGFGLLGCDMRCAYCQNWITSQTFKDANAIAPVYPVTAVELARHAKSAGASVMVSSYNEPLISAEWCAEIFREAKSLGLTTAIVSNGNATMQVLEYLRPCVDAIKVDLKCFSENGYRSLGGSLDRVTTGIRRIHLMGFWLEVVTLLVPGFNDDPGELRQTADFLVSISPNIPWHVTAYHKDYRMLDRPNTQSRALVDAVEIGKAAGLRYVYAGNHGGRVGDCENTRCWACGEAVVKRRGYATVQCEVGSGGACSHCGSIIAGIWSR